MVSRISLQARASRFAASDLCRYSPISSARKEARVRSCAIEVSSRMRGVSDMGVSMGAGGGVRRGVASAMFTGVYIYTGPVLWQVPGGICPYECDEGPTRVGTDGAAGGG